MAANQVLRQIGQTTPNEEWFDFDNSLDLPYSGLGSNPTSIDSVSPKDLELGFADFDDCNWGPNPGVCTEDFFSDIINYDPPCEGYALDGPQPLLNPSGAFQSLPGSPNQGLIASDVMASDLSDAWLQDVGGFDDPFYANIRQMVELQAAADPGCLSSKEKRMEASIAIHLQRLQDAAMQELDLSSNSSTTFPSPRWSDSAQMSVSQSGTWATPATSPSSETLGNPSTSAEPTGGMEMVLDLNMNTTTNVPKKQKPRSRAQKENYIKVRKAGACEKHRKQHKRCNCLEKVVSQLSVSHDAVSVTHPAVRSTVNVQLHVPGSGKGVVHAKTIPTVTAKAPVLHTTGGLVSREDQHVQLRQAGRSPNTSPSFLRPQYGHHSQCAAQASTGCPNTGQPGVLCQPIRSPVPSRSVGLVQPSSSTSSQPDQKLHTRMPTQAPGRLRSVPAVSTHLRASFEASVVLESHSVGDQRRSTEDTKLRSSSPEGRAVAQHPSSCDGSSDAQRTIQSVSSNRRSVSSALQWGRNAVSSVLRSVSTLSRVLEPSIFAESALGSYFGRVVLLSSRKLLVARKGLGLY
ncbi:hypothetical protein BO70DRAFT_358388 [Aspergillus heteromorphus CBS 117.55]|uniref:Uncharacterized protein n=1 Tax=Aspergillus heteromorphus CBS 117.55 TaxID=1448321 RepID=A0A317X037_9EURO|nr:uncharacterized protein BO70DRAFT_358388 [Aspergillus heteromorphus CBS 117.55]PWY90917.1 hypothetical protein BO70DRAFT_358388 [Aspergillus heteromorphus CBS 117.55]